MYRLLIGYIYCTINGLHIECNHWEIDDKRVGVYLLNIAGHHGFSHGESHGVEHFEELDTSHLPFPTSYESSRLSLQLPIRNVSSPSNYLLN